MAGEEMRAVGREISPSYDVAADDFLQLLSPERVAQAEAIRAQKRLGSRPRPSQTLIDHSQLLDAVRRRALLDRIALLVDENVLGRAELCLQFAQLLQRSLTVLGIASRVVVGDAIYHFAGREAFRWEHAWVRAGAEVVDGNADLLAESPAVPPEARSAPYWGPVEKIPAGLRLRERRGALIPSDRDVDGIWWPELETWIETLRKG